MIRLICLLLVLAMPARAQEEIVLGLSRDAVDITATFDGSDILIFGAIKRTSPPPEGSRLGVIVTVRGPSEKVMVRRKERIAGIWINADAAPIDVAPSFFAVASNGKLSDILSRREDRQHRISILHAVRTIVPANRGVQEFIDALVRIRAGKQLYQVLEDGVDLTDDTLFRTRIELPANLTEGDYRAEIFLTRDREVVDVYRTTIPVQKVGLERWLYTLAHEQALIYGLMSLAIAIAAGWLASAAFGLLRR